MKQVLKEFSVKPKPVGKPRQYVCIERTAMIVQKEVELEFYTAFRSKNCYMHFEKDYSSVNAGNFQQVFQSL